MIIMLLFYCLALCAPMKSIDAVFLVLALNPLTKIRPLLATKPQDDSGHLKHQNANPQTMMLCLWICSHPLYTVYVPNRRFSTADMLNLPG